MAVLMVFGVCTLASSQTFTVLYDFSGGNDGGVPTAGLVFDTSGNLYGTTQSGGTGACFLGCGTVFEMSPVQGGGWTFTTLYSFQGGSNAAYPNSALTIDGFGNLFGSSGGGSANCPTPPGCGTIFEISPNGQGGWKETVLYSFLGGEDGDDPRGVVLDAAGNLYGTAAQGGASCTLFSVGCGTAFELSPNGTGGWHFKVLHQFGAGTDGALPFGALASDGHGNFYGTTQYGGSFIGTCTQGCGTIFRLSQQNGRWTENVLHRFQVSDGSYPAATPTLDSSGDIFVTTNYGGSQDAGVVFELTPVAGGWQSHLRHAFGSFQDGTRPGQASVALDRRGDVYSTTFYGGQNPKACQNNIGSGCGVLYRLTPTASGMWKFTLLYSFTGGSDGNYPYDGPTLDSQGHLFGTTSYRGQATTGSVFEFIPWVRPAKSVARI
jgi:uncharacterized repeat protein (TIGR03803 family)